MRLVPPQSMIQLPTVRVRPAPRPVAAAPPSPAASATGHALEELSKLGALKAQGVIDDAEFAALKARILAD
jgi:hypothetical protein